MSGQVSQAVRHTSAGRRAPRQPAAELPVARVAVDISLPHLDRPFDYLVPDTMAATAVPGSQVRVRFAGQLTGGFVLERRADSEHEGKLGYLERVVAAEPVLTAEVAGLARAVADRYGGTMADVLRLAIPPRHARASKQAAEPGAEPAASAERPAGAERPASTGTPASAEPGPARKPARAPRRQQPAPVPLPSAGTGTARRS